MNSAPLNQAFRVLVFAVWAQKTVWCQYYSEQIGDGRGGHNEEHHEEHHVKPLYKFGYWVHDPKTKDVKNHWEHRDGDVVHGSYSLLQPDGHVRVVEYSADKHSGFNAHVKYVYEGHGGGSSDGGNSGGGGGGGGGGFGGGFNQHLEDASGGQSSAPIGGGGYPKQPLHKFYKKPRAEKPGGQPGQYKKPHHNFDNHSRPKSPAGGGGFKKSRPAAGEQSAEHYPAANHNRSPNNHFDQLSKFSTGGGGGGGGSHERHHGGSPFGLGDQGGGPVNHLSSDHFARKYSSPMTAALTSSSEKSGYFTGIRHQSSEYDSTAHRRPDVASAASTERRLRSSSEEQRPNAQQPSVAAAEPQQRQQQPTTTTSLKQNVHEEFGAAERGGPGDDEPLFELDEEPQQQFDDTRSLEQDDRESVIRIQKQPLREYHFDEPYPFEIPENVRQVRRTTQHHTRHSDLQPVRRHTHSSSYFPSWYGTTVMA